MILLQTYETKYYQIAVVSDRICTVNVHFSSHEGHLAVVLA